MTLGLGTGSTAAIFVELLADALAAGRLRDIRGVCTSSDTEALAQRRGVPTLQFRELTKPIDVAIDGADEVDPALRLIKGRGGALLREKIVEQASREFICIVDQSKIVEKLGVGPLPVETVRFSSAYLLRSLIEEGVPAVVREKNGNAFVTDEGHHILDVSVPADEEIALFVERLRRRAGVVETGFFPTEATRVLVASRDGVRELTR